MRSRRITLALAVAALATLGGCIFVRAAFPPAIAVRDVSAPIDAASVARGKYLADHVAGCTGCHAERDYGLLAGPVKAGTEGAGGETWDAAVGFPGRVAAPNITPGALSGWSDGEILRAMVNGVSKDGTPLFPIMPYPAYGEMAESDALAIIAYLRTLPGRDTTHPPRVLEGPLGFIVKAMPRDAELLAEAPAPGSPAYGAYVANVAHCVECHTEVDDRGRRLEGQDYAGGRAFTLPTGGTVRSANITPDGETGIGRWTKDAFVARFRAFAPESLEGKTVAEGEFNTVMPWASYAGMTDEDLGALFDHLMSLPGKPKSVTRFSE